MPTEPEPTDDEPLGFSNPLRSDLAADTPPQPRDAAAAEQPSESEREETGR